MDHLQNGVTIRAIVLLAGSVRPTELSRTINRSLLDLPITNGRTILDSWEEQATPIVGASGAGGAGGVGGVGVAGVLDIDVLLDRTSPAPTVHARNPHIAVRVMRDEMEFRGTGGVLRDVAREYDEDDLLLVCNAATILHEPLAAITEQLLHAGGDVSLIASDDGLPGAVMLVRRRVLTSVRDVGFIDFKEQVLPKLAAEHRIGVVKRHVAPGIPVRTGEGYIDGLFAYHRLRAGRAAEIEDPFAEEWASVFRVIEDGASVHSDATVHDSVVLSGGRVERGAVIVRSVVCPGGVVRAGEAVVDEVVGPDRAQARRHA